ncbi:hypothetical protein NQ315_006853 [Exocentrus adspersus]|uniref:Tyr recombinase domain-containing protein n=1 Tax=Exocentrus adspersus TaxID=1586481 RepID=A0AAV8WCM8_9CUCU|nr:hypothetical protein NQ315_006853 [Exocentrus adspersus]
MASTRFLTLLLATILLAASVFAFPEPERGYGGHSGHNGGQSYGHGGGHGGGYGHGGGHGGGYGGGKGHGGGHGGHGGGYGKFVLCFNKIVFCTVQFHFYIHHAVVKFTIIEEGFCVNAIEICRKYISLRPIRLTQNRFFLRYMNQKCTSQPVGINSFAKVPSIVASFLNLPNAELYTGHCMRRTSTTLLADKGADLTTTKRHGGWKSSAVAESYIEDSTSNKLDIARKVQGESNVTRSENDGNNPTRVVINGKEVTYKDNKTQVG